MQMTVVLSVATGVTCGVLLSVLERRPTPVRLLIVSMALALLAAGALRIGDDSASQQYGAGVLAFGVTTLLVLAFKRRPGQQPGDRPLDRV